MRPLEQVIRAEVLVFGELLASERKLVLDAIFIREQAYAPYSNYLVGAAVATMTERYLVGCNVEAASYTQTTHAEQNAISAMTSQEGPNARLAAVACIGAPRGAQVRVLEGPATDNLGPSFLCEAGSPSCGQCLQIIWEHCDGNRGVVLLSVRADGYIIRTSIGDAFPMAFGPLDLGMKTKE